MQGKSYKKDFLHVQKIKNDSISKQHYTTKEIAELSCPFNANFGYLPALPLQKCWH